MTNRNLSQCVLEISDLHVKFPIYGGADIEALRDVSLKLTEGEVLGLVGESGSGKTVLARSIMGLVPPPGKVTQGSILFCGKDLSLLSKDNLRTIRGREISMIIPNPRSELNPLFRVGRQIAQVAKYHLDIPWKDAEKMAMEMLEEVAIHDPKRRFKAFPHELSGGMAQRIVMANALICSPKLIISDDATSGLDVTVQAQVLNLMRRLVKDFNTSTLFITRDIGVTAHFCDRIAIIYAGEIVEVAGVKEFFLNPCHPYSIMLLAAFSHNPDLRKQWSKGGTRFKRREAGEFCSFVPRCVIAKSECRERERPRLDLIGRDHYVRCYFPVKRETNAVIGNKRSRKTFSN